jgi:hypothetical protein
MGAAGAFEGGGHSRALTVETRVYVPLRQPTAAARALTRHAQNRSNHMMRRILVALAGAACALTAGAAQARDVYWSVGVSSPGVGAVFSNAPQAPVYVAPAPVVYAPPPPVYYVEPAPVYYVPPPRVVYRPVPVVVRPAPVYYVKGHGHHHKHKWHHRHGGRDEYGDRYREGRWQRDDPRNYRH